MSQRQKIRVSWPGRFPKGIVTAIDNLNVADDLLTEGTLNVWPYRLGYLGPWPAFESFCSDWATEFGLDPSKTFPKRITGITTWSQEPGMDYIVVAVYGIWPEASLTWTGTKIFFFRSDAAGDHLSAITTEVTGDGPVRFAQMPLWSDILLKRVNQLVVCSPYHYTQLIALDNNEVPHPTVLPYMASEAAYWKSRLWLTGAAGYPSTAFYSGIEDVENWETFEVGEGEADPNLGFITANDILYVRKSKSLWNITSSDPLVRQINKVLSRGGCVYFPRLGKQGMLNCDEKGLYYASGQFEQLQELSVQVPQIRAERKHLVPWFERIFVETQNDFLNNTLFQDVAIENRGTADVPIHVLTLDHDAEGVMEQETTGGSDKAIGPTIGDSVYQTFKEDPDTSDCYWLTKVELQLKYSGSASEVYGEIVKYKGSPSDPDEEEVIGDEVLSVTNAAYNGWYTINLPERTYLYPNTEWKYMIRLTCISGTTHWNYNNADPYAYGEASWGASDDACFKTYGYQYLDSGTWISEWFDKTTAKRWGALLYSALEKEDGWELRTQLSYRFQNASGLTTSWVVLSTSSDRPSGEALDNTYIELTPPYTKVQFRIQLLKMDEIPPFIDWLLCTYSREVTEDETVYPCGIEYEDKIFLAGVKPYEHGVVVRNESDAIFMTGNQVGVSHFVEWRSQLWAGQSMESTMGISSASSPPQAALLKVHKDSESTCKFMNQSLIFKTNRKWVGEQNDKDLFELFVIWLEKKGVIPQMTLKAYLLTDEGRLQVDLTTADIEQSNFADYLGAKNVVQKIARVLLPVWTTKTLGLEIQAIPAAIGYIDESEFPWFRFLGADVDAIAWPPPRFTK